ncbi:MAG: ribosome recycling factor [Candidatus Schekmanbacteria bacterium]|nr:MAG: ribosome recycling factor [Candidatus Schekmanbacteria bacterium]
MNEDVLRETEEAMKKAVSFLTKELAKVRTGRANAAILDSVKVDYYGTPTPINQLATISIPESRLIVIQPWDTNVIGLIEKAIMKSDLGLTPNSDGKVIRIPIPELTEERRRELVKTVKKMGEQEKITIRNARRNGNEKLKKLEKEGHVSQDEIKKSIEKIQKITDSYIEKVDELLKLKEEEILTI